VAKQGRRHQASRIAPVIGAAGGAGVGYALGRAAAPAGATAVARMAEGVLGHAAISTAAPVVGTAITGACAILAAVAVPVTVVWMIRREERQDDGEEEGGQA